MRGNALCTDIHYTEKHYFHISTTVLYTHTKSVLYNNSLPLHICVSPVLYSSDYIK